MSVSAKRTMLRPKDVHIRHDDQGYIVLHHGDTVYENVRIKQPFPLSHPSRFVIIEDNDGRFLGMVKDYHRMDAQSRAIVNHELEWGYFLPKIIKIDSISERFGYQVWQVLTDRGPRTFDLKSRKNDIRWLSDQHIVVQDTSGNKYEIENLNSLDPASRAKVEMEA